MQGQVKWAMAGRNRERLEAVRDTCAAANGVAKVRGDPPAAALFNNP